MSPPHDFGGPSKVLTLPVTGNPVGADPKALAGLAAQGIAETKALRSDLDRHAEFVVNKLKSVEDEVTDMKAVLLRVEAGQSRLEAKIGTYPMSDDLVRALERESVRELTPEAIREREARLAAARIGTGALGEMKKTKDALEARDAAFEQRLDAFEQRLTAAVETKMKAETKGAVQDAITEVQDAAKVGNRATLIKGATATGLVTALVALIAALGGSEGIVSIIKALVGT